MAKTFMQNLIRIVEDATLQRYAEMGSIVNLREWFDNSLRFIQERYTNVSGYMGKKPGTNAIIVRLSANGHHGYAEFRVVNWLDRIASNSVRISSTARQTVTSNKGTIIDITPSSNHSVATKNPGLTGRPNSSVDILDRRGNLVTRRWFGSNGRQVRDVDFKNHGNIRTHPEYPHQHGPR